MRHRITETPDAARVRAAFDAETRERCRQGLRVLLGVCLALAPLLALLDFHRAPEAALTIQGMRVLAVGAYLMLFAGLGEPSSARVALPLVLLVGAVVTVAAGAAAAFSGWHASPYMQFLPGVLFMVAFLVPVPPAWMAALCVEVAALFAGASIATATVRAPGFADGLFLLLVASGIAVGTSIARQRLRWRAFTDRVARDAAQAALAESEQRFRTMADAAPALMWMTDAKLRTSFVNQAWREFTGGGEELLEGERWRALVHPDDQDAVLRRVLAAAQAPAPYRLEFRLRRFDGAFRWVIEHAVPRLGPEGRLEGYVGTLLDVTDQKDAAATLAGARDEAVEATRLKSEFLANVSHELRTPMAAVMGMAELLLGSSLTPQQREQVETIETSASALLGILNDILDYSRLEAGRLDLDAVPFALRDCVHDALRPLGPRAEQRGIELACDVDPAVPQRVVGDPARVRQILANLAGNAVKFTERGEVVVRVQPAGDGIEIRVRDTGIGIPPEKHAEMFAAFAQADGATSRRFGGTGLGLAICARLAEGMGGRLWFESAPGSGSTFHVQLPLAAAAALAPGDEPLLAGIRVLVVDDSATSREIVAGLLRAGGADPTAVTGGGEALAAITAASQAGQPFGLAIVDLHMPGMDGFALAGAIRALPAPADATPILLASAGLGGAERDRCRELGIAGPVAKPVRGVDLLAAARRAIGGTAPAAPAAPPAPALRRLRILVAEDDPVIRQLVSTLLARDGHAVTAVEDGVRALATLAPGGFDAVVMDVDMPVLSGLGATAPLRARGDHVPVIGLAPDGSSERATRCREAGMGEIVTKPVRHRELLAAIERAIAPTAPADVVLDREWVLDQANNDPAVLLRLVDLFLADGRATLGRLHQAIAAADCAALHSAAHRLKGALAMMGARRAAQAAAALEEAGRTGDLDRAPGLLAGLERDFSRLEPELAALTGAGAAA